MRSAGVVKQGNDVSILDVYQDLIKDLRSMESRYRQQPDEFVFTEADAAVATKSAEMLEFMLMMMGKTEERHQYELAALEDKRRREDCSHMDLRAPSLNWGP